MPQRELMVIICFILIGLFTSPAQATLADPYSQGLVDEVSFWLHDDPDSNDPGEIVLSTMTYGLPAGYQLEYFYSGVSDWTVLGPATSFATTVEGSKLVFLRLYNPDTGVEDRSGELTFLGLEGTDLYTTLAIDWDESYLMALSITTAGNDDNLAPQAPLPGAVWLLGPGLVGILCTRKRRGN